MLGYPRDDSVGELYRLFEVTFLENTPRGIGRSEAHLAPTSTRVHEGCAAFSLPTSRITVPTPRPTSRAIRRMPMPCERSLSTAFTLPRGSARPSGDRVAYPLREHELTRSLPSLVSLPARTPRIHRAPGTWPDRPRTCVILNRGEVVLLWLALEGLPWPRPGNSRQF